MSTQTAVLETTLGEIHLELNQEKAPQSVANFIEYIKQEHYNNTLFHRVIDGFMVQGGGMNADMTTKATREPIQNEANNGLKNEIGTVAMARTQAPHSATAQFFINVANNTFLNHTAETPEGWGYAVFGKVTTGMDVINRMAKVQTTSKGHHKDVPVEDIFIKNAYLEEEKPSTT